MPDEFRQWTGLLALVWSTSVQAQGRAYTRIPGDGACVDGAGWRYVLAGRYDTDTSHRARQYDCVRGR